MSHYFICAIGPVQEFIRSARRSRDLWYGSWMLSELSKAAAKRIADLFPGGLIFPAPDDPLQLNPNSELSVPNRVVAIAEGDAVNIGEEVKNAIVKRLDELRKDAFALIKGDFDKDLADKQVDDLPEIYWVSVPSNNDYSLTRDMAEALMAARKTTRDFRQMIGSDALKSSLDGNRESVIPEAAYPDRNDSSKIRQQKITNLYKAYRAHHGERLSGVDLLKRLGGRNLEPKFKSTSHMAAIPFLEKVDTKKGKGQSDQLLKAIRDLIRNEITEKTKHSINIEVDGSLVFENRLTDWISANDISEDLHKKFNEILKKYAGDAKPNPYYALLAADGDNMGKIIDAQKDPNSHRKLSQALSKFAADVFEIVNRYLGMPIYSGGDDVLAYLPLHKVLDCAAELETQFKERMREFIVRTNTGEVISPSLSIGIAIVHHLEQLSEALEMVREAEKEAKKVKGKNGLAICLSKRGGVNRTISGKWGILDKRLKKLIEFTSSGLISAGTPYELQGLHRGLSAAEVPPEGLEKEAMRIIARKRETGGKRMVDPEVKEVFEQWLIPKKGQEIDKKPEENVTVDQLAMEMIIAREFSRSKENGKYLAEKKEVAQ